MTDSHNIDLDADKATAYRVHYDYEIEEINQKLDRILVKRTLPIKIPIEITIPLSTRKITQLRQPNNYYLYCNELLD